MSNIRYEFHAELEVLSPLHIGSGEKREVSIVKGKPGEKDTPDVAAIVRDVKHHPYIPATTLKGAFRRVGERCLENELLKALFGEIRIETHGQMGAALFRGATLLGDLPDTSIMPYGQEPMLAVEPLGLGAGVFVAARTKINSANGTADDNKLYFQEMVAPGTKFSFRLTLLGRNTKLAEEQAKAFMQILTILACDEGISLGKGEADGQRRVRLDQNTISIKKHILNCDGDFDETDDTKLWKLTPERLKNSTENLWVLRFHCREPFAILDSSYEPPQAEATNENTPQLKAQRSLAKQTNGNELPLILGSSVTGALRARARWLVALDVHRETPNARDKKVGVVGDERVVSTPFDIANLSQVERLFGVTGFRALLEVSHPDVTRAEPYDITSVKLDRFSGAPIDNALFRSDVFINTEFTLHLKLQSRKGYGAVIQKDRDFAERLIKDICSNGLELGHGANKGFGWFEVHEVSSHDS